MSLATAEAALRRAVRPAGWTNPTPAACYDLVVVGGGTAGLVASAGAAALGARVALVERDRLGGECLNVGCVPSKALLRSARAASEARDTLRLGVDAGAVSVDFPRVVRRMRTLRAKLALHDSAERFAGLGVDVFLGEARFRSPSSLAVGGALLRFVDACLATGSRPVVPPIEGLEEAGYLTNETLFDLEELPPRLAVLGGGPIGCEMAQAFAAFGSEVCLFEAGPRILAHDDEDAARVVARALEREGVTLLVDHRLERVARAPDGALSLGIAGPRERGQRACDALLVATGRRPVTEGLGLEAAGVRVGEDGALVDRHLRTSNPRIWAAGDVALEERFTHTADATARLVVRNALFPGRASKDSIVVPWCTYTWPALARVGLSTDEARERGIGHEVHDLPWSAVDRAVLDGETEGFLRLVTLPRGGELLGATIVGTHAADLATTVATAMAGKRTLRSLAGVLAPYPTHGEALRMLADRSRGERLTPRTKKLLAAWLALRRRARRPRTEPLS